MNTDRHVAKQSYNAIVMLCDPELRGALLWATEEYFGKVTTWAVGTAAT
jgi:hypothetical protein